MVDNSKRVLKEPTLSVSAARSHAVLRASLLPLEASRILFWLVGARSWSLKARQLLKEVPFMSRETCSTARVTL